MSGRKIKTVFEIFLTDPFLRFEIPVQNFSLLEGILLKKTAGCAILSTDGLSGAPGRIERRTK